MFSSFHARLKELIKFYKTFLMCFNVLWMCWGWIIDMIFTESVTEEFYFALIVKNFIYKTQIKTDSETKGDAAEIWAAPGWDMCPLWSPVRDPGQAGVCVWGVFVSITEQQTGPLEMKEPEWSQSKTSPAGDRYHTDSSGPRLGPPTMNDPSSWIRSV